MWVAIKLFLSKIPPKVYIVLTYIALFVVSIWLYGKLVEHQTETRVKAEYNAVADKALQDDLRKLKEDLSDAIASKKKLEQRASELRIKASEYANEVGELNNELEILKSQDITCRDINPKYHSLLNTLLPAKTNSR